MSIQNKENSSVELTQTCLIQRIIVASKLENDTPKQTPSDTIPLASDHNGTSYSEIFNYASLLGMLT